MLCLKSKINLIFYSKLILRKLIGQKRKKRIIEGKINIIKMQKQKNKCFTFPVKSNIFIKEIMTHLVSTDTL